MSESTLANDDPVLLVLTNFPDQETARQIGTNLVERQLVACVNLLPPATSVFRWQGKLETATEIPALLKTTRSAFERLSEVLEKLHPYEVPEILAFEAVAGAKGYLDWVRSEVRSASL
jgi:periplasmic divalent cation tolerance protein